MHCGTTETLVRPDYHIGFAELGGELTRPLLAKNYDLSILALV